jgi:ParB family chromosome partitioning protein
MPRQRRAPDVSFFDESATPEPAAARLSQLFAGSTSDEAPPQRIAIAQLQDNPFQPRQGIDPASIAELASVIKTQGFQGTLVARPHPAQPGVYELAFGHRRREAARHAGLTNLPVIVQRLTNEDMITLAITENIQRSDLTPLEEGDTYRLMIDQLGYTQEQIAHEIGKDRGYVVNRLRAARAPEDVRALVAAKPDTLRAVAYLLKVRDPARRAELIAQLRSGMLTGDTLPEFLPEPAVGPARPAPTAPRERAGEREAAGSAGEASLQPRVANRKLLGVLRSLTTYRDSLQARESVSMRELITLTDIKRVVDELYELCRPELDES